MMTLDQITVVPREVIDRYIANALARQQAEATPPPTPPPSPRPTPAPVRTSRPAGTVQERARRYLARLAPSVAGQHGHDRLFRAACVLVHGFDLSEDDALPLLMEFNDTRCFPMWSERDLRHKLTEAVKAPGERGKLLRSRFDATAPVQDGDSLTSVNDADNSTAGRTLRNFRIDEVRDGETMKQVKIGRSPGEICADLMKLSGDWPMRVGKSLFAHRDGRIVWLEDHADLFAWVGSILPTTGPNPLEWARGDGMPTPSVFMKHLAQTVRNWDAVEEYPHFPELPGVCYLHPPVTSGTGAALNEFMSLFSFSTSHDYDLTVAFLLTLVWGGRVGKRPVFLFVAEENDPKMGRGSGKTTLAQMAAEIVGGCMMFNPSDHVDVIQTRMLSELGRRRRVAILDNIKATRLSSATIESLITTRVVSGKELWKGEGQRPNYVTFAMTFNQPSVSKDLAERCVTIRLRRPKYDPTWTDRAEHLIGPRKWELISDLASLMRREPIPLDKYTRWPDWERDILGRMPDPKSLAGTVAERQRDIDDEDREAVLVREAFATALQNKGFNPETDVVFIPAKKVAEIYCEATGERLAIQKACSDAYRLNIPEIRKTRRAVCSGAEWRGAKSEPGATCSNYERLSD